MLDAARANLLPAHHDKCFGTLTAWDTCLYFTIILHIPLINQNFPIQKACTCAAVVVESSPSHVVQL